LILFQTQIESAVYLHHQSLLQSSFSSWQKKYNHFRDLLWRLEIYLKSKVPVHSNQSTKRTGIIKSRNSISMYFDSWRHQIFQIQANSQRAGMLYSKRLLKSMLKMWRLKRIMSLRNRTADLQSHFHKWKAEIIKIQVYKFGSILGKEYYFG